MTEKIRKLENTVRFAGALAELNNVREGTTQDGIPYISFDGVIQCGTEQVYQNRFRTFVKSKKKDGTDSKNYASVKKWVAEAVPMTADPDHPTYVEATGSVADRPYVNREGNLIESTEINLQFFRDFKEYKAEIDLEGFIQGLKDETKGVESEELTGRQRMRLISRDIFGNMLDFKSIVIPEELVEPMAENGYERGATTTFYISLMPNQKVKAVKTGGIGTQRVEGGRPYLEWVVTGAEPVIDDDSENALSPKLIKAAMVERQTKLDQIKEDGYLGNKNTTSTNRTGLGNVAAPKQAVSASLNMDDDSNFPADDDFPF